MSKSLLTSTLTLVMVTLVLLQLTQVEGRAKSRRRKAKHHTAPKPHLEINECEWTPTCRAIEWWMGSECDDLASTHPHTVTYENCVQNSTEIGPDDLAYGDIHWGIRSECCAKPKKRYEPLLAEETLVDGHQCVWSHCIDDDEYDQLVEADDLCRGYGDFEFVMDVRVCMLDGIFNSNPKVPTSPFTQETTGVSVQCCVALPGDWVTVNSTEVQSDEFELEDEMDVVGSRSEGHLDSAPNPLPDLITNELIANVDNAKLMAAFQEMVATIPPDSDLAKDEIKQKVTEFLMKELGLGMTDILNTPVEGLQNLVGTSTSALEGLNVVPGTQQLLAHDDPEAPEKLPLPLSSESDSIEFRGEYPDSHQPSTHVDLAAPENVQFPLSSESDSTEAGYPADSHQPSTSVTRDEPAAPQDIPLPVSSSESTEGVDSYSYQYASEEIRGAKPEPVTQPPSSNQVPLAEGSLKGQPSKSVTTSDVPVKEKSQTNDLPPATNPSKPLTPETSPRTTPESKPTIISKPSGSSPQIDPKTSDDDQKVRRVLITPKPGENFTPYSSEESTSAESDE